MKLKVVPFQNLQLYELYQILQLRAQVFVVEQDCVYQDIDGKDEKAMHLMGFEGVEMVAYTRIFPPKVYFEEAAIGRILVKENFRDKGYGHEILKSSIQIIKDVFETSTIKLSAQTYLINFYQSHGFRPVGEEYLEDGIPHIAMIKN